MVKKMISILILISIITAGFLEKNVLIQTIKQGDIYAVLFSIVLVAITVFFPIVPFTVLGGIIGALFGAVKGGLISYTGAMAGTLIFFLVCRYGFKDWAQKKLKKYPKVQGYEEFLNRRSFLAILIARLIPVLPAPVFNSACGLSKVNWKVFFIASAIGKIPNILVLSFAGANAASNKWFSLSLYGSYMAIILLITAFFLYRKIPKETIIKK
jgi:uncharacterized membrane protein YdjX (TVP38/TMEM64 family)